MNQRPPANHTGSVLIFGAASTIATEVARRFASDHAALFLVDRVEETLLTLQDDLLTRGASHVETAVVDLSDVSTHQPLLERAKRSLGELNWVLVAYAVHGEQRSSRASVERMLFNWQINATSTLALLTLLANELEQQGHGTLAAISSVSGDRGYRSNYLYGASKAALNTFLSGLRARFVNTGIRVVTIKPGLVDTPMTAYIKKKGPLFASPEQVGKDIYRAMLRGKAVIYTPGYWRFIMFIIRALPEPVFKRMRY
jgi:short-subunit dehydrogenase